MKKVHFIGIGGIGMSALAQMLKHDGVEVSGSDRDASSKVHDVLAEYGITVTAGHNPANVPTDADVVVYSDAVVEGTEGFVEREKASELGIRQLSYFCMLGEVSKGKKTVAVAGTHGKTTTTGMLGKILVDVGASPTVIVGSIVKDFGSNYVAGDSNLFVVEACEYRDHLLELAPEVLVITNLEWDHTDWFPSLAALQETFAKAIERVPAHGTIITDPSNPNIAPLLARAKAQVVDYTKESAYELRLPGEFNQMNARAAAAAARIVLGDSVKHVKHSVFDTSLATFQGTWRRFEYKGKTANGAEVYDDYAHHPTAVRETLRALREKLRKATPCGKIYVAFHPHLYSRTKDLFEEFAAAFGDADKVFIAPIYAAREVDDGTVSSEKLAARIRELGGDATALDFSGIEAAFASAGPGDVVMTMGAGDIYKVADRVVH